MKLVLCILVALALGKVGAQVYIRQKSIEDTVVQAYRQHAIAACGLHDAAATKKAGGPFFDVTLLRRRPTSRWRSGSPNSTSGSGKRATRRGQRVSGTRSWSSRPGRTTSRRLAATIFVTQRFTPSSDCPTRNRRPGSKSAKWRRSSGASGAESLPHRGTPLTPGCHPDQRRTPVGNGGLSKLASVASRGVTLRFRVGVNG